MPDTIEMAVDRLRRGKRQELFLALLTYAGPPPREGSYRDWCSVVETGVKHMYPAWSEIDRLDATIQFRHWCARRSLCRSIGKTKKYFETLIRRVMS